MARYYFHLYDGGDVLIDYEGREVVSHDEVALLTLREARAIISYEALDGRIGLAQALVVEDAAHLPIHRLAFADAVEIVRR